MITAGNFTDIGSSFSLGTVSQGAGNAQSSVDLSVISSLQSIPLGTAVDLRLVAWGAGYGANYAGFNSFESGDDLIVNGTVPVPEPSTYTMTLAGIACGGYSMFRRRTLLLVAALMFSPLVASAQSTYTTANGELNLVAGLTNLSSVTAIGTTNQSVGINYITDSSWSATGIANLGSSGGTLAGTFGGANYFASSNDVILIGAANSLGNPAWGSWTVRMLLSDDTYSSPINYTNSNLENNTNSAARLETNNTFFLNSSGNIVTSTNALFNTLYQQLDIADFDTGNIGVKGIELSSMGSAFPDISYIGVTSPVPEPSTCIMALAGLACGGYSMFRRRHAR